MFNENIKNLDEYAIESGSQVKYRINNNWYKLDYYGNEGIAEKIASIILKHTSLNNDKYIIYENGFLNGFPACKSENFLSDTASFISLQKLYLNITGNDLSKLMVNTEFKDRLPYTLDFFKEHIGIDLYNYFSRIMTLDYIILNEDRHWNNLGVIYENGIYKEAPIFDNGRSLLVGNFYQGPYIKEIVEEEVIARPFYPKHKQQMDLFGPAFYINFEKAIAEIVKLEDSLQKEIAIKRLEELQKSKEIPDFSEREKDDIIL